MHYHYIVIIAIIFIIVIIQFWFFASTKRKIKLFSGIFPKNSDGYGLNKEILIEQINSSTDDELDKMLIVANLDRNKYNYVSIDAHGEEIFYFHREQAQKDLIDKLSSTTNGISVSHDNEILQTIIISINDYLQNNKSVSDYHLLKDIVDRNCDAKEEEINTQIPIPLYFGLVGTMMGILIGVGFLVFDGSLAALLGNGTGNGAAGVEALLGGVAVAMISSILGIILTTLGSNGFKTAKSILEANQHTFLSWIQAKLLPTLSDNVVGAIREMTNNLTEFNKAFSDNTSNLAEALAKVNESYRLQTQLIETVNKIQEGRTAATNLTLLNKLIESSEQIGQLAEYLHNTNEYLANVRALNEKLDLHENRTQTIEEVGVFFRTELEQIEARKGAISRAVGMVDDYLKQALEKLKESGERQFNELLKSSVKQQDILQQKSQELEKLVAELEQLSAVKDSISKFEIALNTQNSKLDNLTNAIHEFAKSKAEGTNAPIFIESTMQVRKKILIGTISALGGLTLIAFIIANWNSIYQFLCDIFQL